MAPIPMRRTTPTTPEVLPNCLRQNFQNWSQVQESASGATAMAAVGAAARTGGVAVQASAKAQRIEHKSLFRLDMRPIPRAWARERKQSRWKHSLFVERRRAAPASPQSSDGVNPH